MKSNIQTDVLVVGAGPVGMLTALLLGESGIHVEVIDQESRTAGHSYACALHPRSLELLDRAGIAGCAIKLGRIVDTIEFYEGKIRRCALKLSELPVEFPYVLVLPQSGLEDFLEKKLKQLPNVRFHWNRRLNNFQMTGPEIIATIDKLAYTAKGYITPEFEVGVESQFRIQAGFMVGADGHDSITRQCVGIQSEKTGGPVLFAVYEFETDEQIDHEMKVVLDGGTISVMWPLAHNKCRWSFQMPQAEPSSEFPQKDRTPFTLLEPEDSENRRRLQRLLCERAPWFKGAIKDINWTTDIQFEHWVASEFGRGRVWLAGDAAHQTGPVGMQSMNLGLREAADLASVLKRILRSEGSLDLLQTYGRDHRAKWQKLLGATGVFMSPKDTPAWAIEYCASIPGCLPASGSELTQLLGSLGIVCK